VTLKINALGTTETSGTTCVTTDTSRPEGFHSPSHARQGGGQPGTMSSPLGSKSTQADHLPSNPEATNAQSEALRYKPEGRGFDNPWCHWNFSLT